jgi:hypothetical protein
MKSFSAAGIAILAILLLFSVSGSMHISNSASSEPLTFTLSGEVLSAGTQLYTIGQSGSFEHATVDGLSLSQGNINYTLSATVSGMSVTGNADFVLKGSLVGGGTINVSSGTVPIIGMLAAACLPNYDVPNSTTGSCDSNDTSAVPEFFVGIADIKVTTSTGTNAVLSGTELMFESAYSNPFGNAIIIASTDTPPSTVIITNYTSATVDWNSVIDAGTINGTYGGNPITGDFTYNASEQENLITGKANDSGTMTFYNATEGGSPLNELAVTGTYSGNSTIPTAGATHCSALIGFPGTGVCTETGFTSSGSYNLDGPLDTIVGTYSSTWSIPAFWFNGTSSANVLPLDPPSVSTPSVDGNVIWYNPTVQGTEYVYPASVAINGVQFSATFYESLAPQYLPVRGLLYAGYYSGTFAAISGCQPGASITITATVNGVTESATGTCPAVGSALVVSLVFGTPLH